MEQNFDIFIAFHASATVPLKAISADESSLMQAKIVEISWSSYNVAKKEVDIDFQKIIQFDSPLTEELVQRTRITKEKLQEAVPLEEALNFLASTVEERYKKNNLSVCIVTFGSELFTLLLPKEAKSLKINLAPEFLSFFDIAEEFRAFFTQFNQAFESPNDVLRKVNLKIVEEDTVCLTECKSLIRIMNILVRNKHKFSNLKRVELPVASSPVKTNATAKPNFDALLQNDLDEIMLPSLSPKQDSVISASNPTPSPTPVLSLKLSRHAPPRSSSSSRYRDSAPWKSYIRARSPEPFKDGHRTYYIKLRGLPYNCSQGKIKEFLRGVRVDNENICFFYDSTGKFIGEVYALLYNYEDFKLALSFSHGEINSRYIEVLDSNEMEFKRARDSDKPELSLASTESELIDLEGQNGVVQLRGLPFSATDEDIEKFMRPCVVKEVRRIKSFTGRLCGECFVVLESKEEVSKALALNMEKIGHRFIEVFASNLKELEYHCNIFSGNDSVDILLFEHNIQLDRKPSIISVSGIPLQTQKPELAKAFDGFGIKDEDVLYFEVNGKFTGKALVVFESVAAAKRALRERQRVYLGNRLLELSELA